MSARDTHSKTPLIYAAARWGTHQINCLRCSPRRAVIVARPRAGAYPLTIAVRALCCVRSGFDEVVKQLILAKYACLLSLCLLLCRSVVAAAVLSCLYRVSARLLVAARTLMLHVSSCIRADVEAKDNKGKTALHWAVVGGHAGVVRLLLWANADPDAQDARGQVRLLVPCTRACFPAPLRATRSLIRYILMHSHTDGGEPGDSAGPQGHRRVPAAAQGQRAERAAACGACRGHSGGGCGGRPDGHRQCHWATCGLGAGRSGRRFVPCDVSVSVSAFPALMARFAWHELVLTCVRVVCTGAGGAAGSEGKQEECVVM